MRREFDHVVAHVEIPLVQKLSKRRGARVLVVLCRVYVFLEVGEDTAEGVLAVGLATERDGDVLVGVLHYEGRREGIVVSVGTLS